MQADEKNILEQLAKPIRAGFDLEEMKREQGYQPINKAEFDQLIKEPDIQEPLEDLLACSANDIKINTF
ncbi:hypothetical protein [Haliscomenobacter sp.]|uniref:hypothetical protein n=1 Tax=Haliscomenobacter sp. TaxID=2717303 RepID=UPI00336508DC